MHRQHWLFRQQDFFRLTSPTGPTVSLVERRTYAGSGIGAGRVVVSFGDPAGWEVGGLRFNNGNVTAGELPAAGGAGLLGGRDMFGDWKLTVVAEPATVAVMGMGLLMLGASLTKNGRRSARSA